MNALKGPNGGTHHLSDAEDSRHQPARRREVFENLGYHIARQSGHIEMTNGKNRLVIPRHNPIIAITMGGIARAAGFTPDEFRRIL